MLTFFETIFQKCEQFSYEILFRFSFFYFGPKWSPHPHPHPHTRRQCQSSLPEKNMENKLLVIFMKKKMCTKMITSCSICRVGRRLSIPIPFKIYHKNCAALSKVANSQAFIGVAYRICISTVVLQRDFIEYALSLWFCNGIL